ncbi:MAG: family 20 glycosylhydrolase [Verrucomicrobia bacterium]|nr:family 20 glycosylhydrolase [Verrucomicrobiota bacterium]
MNTPQVQSFRGLHYDLARGNYDSLASLRRLVRFVAECGLNQLAFYMEDLWRYRRHPQLFSPRAYRLEDMGALAEFAAAHGVDFIPSLTTLSHAQHILQKPKYRHLAPPGGTGWNFDALNPGTYELFDELFDEVLPHFNSPYVIIYGDEMDLSCLSGAARKEARRHGLGALYGRGMARVAQMILERGRRPIMTHDMLFHHPKALAYIPKQTIILYWFYDYQPSYPAIPFLCEQGFDVITAPGLILHHGGVPDYARVLPHIQAHAREASRYSRPSNGRGGPGRGSCLGTMTTIWEMLPWQEAALATYATGRWTQNSRLSLNAVLGDFAKDVFGIRARSLSPVFTGASSRGLPAEASAKAGSGGMAAAWRDASLEAERFALAAQAVHYSHSAKESAALQSLMKQIRRRIESHAKILGTGRASRNLDIHRSVRSVIRRMTTFRVRQGEPFQERKLFSPSVASTKDLSCRIERIKTSYGHDLLVLTNGLIAVAILPEFGAAMIEWVLLGANPWSVVLSDYPRWASAKKRRPGDVALESPWGTGRLGGWRETIFYNARVGASSLWGRPFRVRTIRATAAEVAVACVGRNEIAEVRRVVRLQRGKRIIGIDTCAANLIGPCSLALQPNVAHALPSTTTPLLRLVEGRGARDRGQPLINHDGTKLFTPKTNVVRIVSPLSGHSLKLQFRRPEVSRFLTDAGATHFTLEPYGTIRNCTKGESVSLHLKYELSAPGR